MVSINADDELESHMENVINPAGKRIMNFKTSKTTFFFNNIAIGWILTEHFPRCSYNIQTVQQKCPKAEVCHVVEENHILTKPLNPGTTVQFTCCLEAIEHTFTVWSFADAWEDNSND